MAVSMVYKWRLFTILLSEIIKMQDAREDVQEVEKVGGYFLEGFPKTAISHHFVVLKMEKFPKEPHFRRFLGGGFSLKPYPCSSYRWVPPDRYLKLCGDLMGSSRQHEPWPKNGFPPRLVSFIICPFWLYLSIYWLVFKWVGSTTTYKIGPSRSL